jgi:putative Holliday junction resolvase
MIGSHEQPSADTRSGRVAGIDYGTVRIGIAISDTGRRLATPLDVYHWHDREAGAKYFRKLVAENAISQFVVGLPVHLSGNESEKSREAREFGKWLAETTGVDVVFFDERFTTAEAEEHLLQSGLSKKQRAARLDKLAAQIMLTAYLESGQDRDAKPASIDD